MNVAMVDAGVRVEAGEQRAKEARLPANGSCIEVEVNPQHINLFEREGDGATRVLLEKMEKYGLRLVPRVSSPCG